jgi:hypothetical protein
VLRFCSAHFLRILAAPGSAYNRPAPVKATTISRNGLESEKWF